MVTGNYVLAGGVGILANRTAENFSSNFAILGAVKSAQRHNSAAELDSITNIVMEYSKHYPSYSTTC